VRRPLHRDAARRRARGVAPLAIALATACALPAAREPDAAPDPVRVRIGKIDAEGLEGARRAPPAELPERTEQIVDLFWQAGCAGENLEVTLPDYRRTPDVICTLPGRTSRSIVVAGHLDGEAAPDGVPGNWIGAALLPTLYRALRVEPREHSFLFVAFGQSAPRQGFRAYLGRFDEARRREVRAFVDLQAVAPDVLWSSSPDPALRRDLVAVTRALGRPLESLRFFVPRREEFTRGLETPVIVLGDTLETQAIERDHPSVSSGPPGGQGYLDAARVIALFLGYLDETLRLRDTAADPASAASPPAATPGDG
jgi:hypothetical protein